MAGSRRGFTVRKDDKIGRIVFTGHNADIQMRLTETLEDKTRPSVRFDGKAETQTYQIPTGRLRITLQTRYREGPSFEDRDSSRLESQLNRVFAGIYRLVVKVWQKDREHREFLRQIEEEDRRRAEAKRLRAERERALAEERARRRHLSLEAVRWGQSRRIREYVAHIRAAAVEGSADGDALTSWIEWALRVASELDPTETRLRNDVLRK